MQSCCDNLLFPFPLSCVHPALPGLISLIYLVTLSPCHPITSSLVSSLHYVTPHLDTLSPSPHPCIVLAFVLILSLTSTLPWPRPCPVLVLTMSSSSPCPYLDLLLSPYAPEYSLSWTLYSSFSGSCSRSLSWSSCITCTLPFISVLALDP